MAGAVAGGALRDIGRPAAWAQGLLIAQAVACALAAGIALLHGPGFDDEDGSVPYMLVSLVQMLLFIGAACVFLRWTYLASVNVHLMGAQGLGPSPGWAVGWYFVPIACLGMPLVAMRETWKASAQPRDWEIVKASPMLNWWWAFWLLSGFAGMAALRLQLSGGFEEAQSIAETLTTASDLLTIPASLLLAAIVRQVSAMQQGAEAAQVEMPASAAQPSAIITP